MAYIWGWEMLDIVDVMRMKRMQNHIQKKFRDVLKYFYNNNVFLYTLTLTTFRHESDDDDDDDDFIQTN